MVDNYYFNLVINMGFNVFINAVEIARKIMKLYVRSGAKVLDCTVGNGNDTLLLADLVGDEGIVYGFDIQPKALDITKEKLEKIGLVNRVILINDGHENIDHYVHDELDFIIYNLGYMPRGDKRIKTESNTTLESIKKALPLLKNNGLLLVTCYTGHEGGQEECDAVKGFFQQLDQKEYSVLEFNFVNQKNNPPILYGLEKNS